MIDVREAVEYAAERIAGTHLVPLSALHRHVDRLDRERAVYVVCRSGNRAAKAAERLAALGWQDIRVLEGGLVAWAAAGRPIDRGESRVWSLERQVRFTAGLLVLIGLLLGWFLHPSLGLLAAFVGAGLMFSAATDTCAMGLFLARMPWNRVRAQADGCCEGT